MNIKKVTQICLVTAFSFIVIYGNGCSNSVTNPTTSVTFAMSQGPGTTGTIFYCKPSVDVKITKAIVSLSNQYDTLIPPNTNYNYSKDTSYEVSEFNGVQSGQKWGFTFIGTITSGGSAYTSTTSYTVP